MTLAKFVIIITIALTTIAVALIVGAVFLMEKEQKHGGVLHASPYTEFHAADKGPEIIIPLDRYRMIIWTPVEERLPLRNGQYLMVSFRRSKDEVGIGLDYYKDGKFIGFGDNVLAWAELPDPYKK